MQTGDVVECVKPNGFGDVKPGDLGVVTAERTPGDFTVYWGLKDGYHWLPAHYRSSGWYRSSNRRYDGVIALVSPLMLLALAAADAVPVVPDCVSVGG